LIGAANINATGNVLNNVLTGNAGVNVLSGGAGNDTLNGGAGADTLNGGAGADTVNGGAGADNMRGGAGSDVYLVDNDGDFVNESVAGSSGIDTVQSLVSFTLANTAIVVGDVENLTLTGAGDIFAIGNTLDNVLIGNAGDNFLNGDAGNDVLTGGAGNDIFGFNSTLNSDTNIDQITDFSAADDMISLANAAFTALTVGALASEAFHAGSEANTADERIIYDATTGALIYDADGNADGAAVQFATLSTWLTLSSASFLVV
jgi:Ca2+-binding RTX toxin-like protein